MHKLILASISVSFCSVSGALSEEALDPTVALERVVAAVCIAIPVSGSSSEFKLDGDAEVRLEGVLDWLADAGLSGAANYNAAKYAGFMQSEVGARVQIEQDCRLSVYKDFSPLIGAWLTEMRTGKTGDVINSRGDCVASVQGSGSTTTVVCN